MARYRDRRGYVHDDVAECVGGCVMLCVSFLLPMAAFLFGGA